MIKWGIFIASLYCLPYLIFGKDSYLLIHDNLDANLPWIELIVRENLYFLPSHTEIENILGGAPRISLGSEFRFILPFVELFGVFPAYVLNIFLIKLIAFLGMSLLVGTRISDKTIVCLGSAAFALLPFWPSGGLSIAGIPLVLFIFHQLSIGRPRWWYFPLLVAIPFYSSMVATYFFVIPILFFYSLYRIYRNKKSALHLISANAILLVGFIIVEYRNILNLINPRFVSHRSDFKKEPASLSEAWSDALENFLEGQYHAPSHHSLILGLVAMGMIAFLLKYRRKDFELLSGIVLCFVISIVYGFWEWGPVVEARNSFFLTKAFNFSRLHWAHPVIWYMLFILSLDRLKLIFPRRVVILLAVTQILFVAANHEQISAYRKHGITFRNFYAKELFAEIKAFIGEEPKSYRVVSVGIHPAVANFNGLYTLDYYSVNYPLDYKHRFRELIEPELLKNSKAMKYYDNWGSRVYVFPAAKPFNFLATGGKRYDARLDLNLGVFTELGGKYIISAYELTNYQPELEFLRSFGDGAHKKWKLFLYGVRSGL